MKLGLEVLRRYVGLELIEPALEGFENKRVDVVLHRCWDELTETSPLGVQHFVDQLPVLTPGEVAVALGGRFAIARMAP